MSLFDYTSRRTLLVGCLLATATLVPACTVEPLAGVSKLSSSTTPALRSIAIEPVDTRPAQQVRNALLFALHGGIEPVDTRYRLALAVQARESKLAITNDTFAPTAAEVVMRTSYTLTDATTGTTVATGKQTTIAAFDESAQSFSNKRALRDAQDRAASEAAQKIRFSLARDLARR